jgi:hypothetical protein
MAQQVLFQEGLKRLKELKLDEVRCEFILNNIIDDNTDDMVNKAIELLPKELKIKELEKKIYTKESTTGFNMKWHCDDCSIWKHKEGFQPAKNNVKLTDKYSLYHTKLPRYSMVIYLSTYNKDFTGGEFNFVDKQIQPEKYKVIFFDSREIHKVDKIKDGIRKTILVKFYSS